MTINAGISFKAISKQHNYTVHHVYEAHIALLDEKIDLLFFIHSYDWSASMLKTSNVITTDNALNVKIDTFMTDNALKVKIDKFYIGLDW
jgi:hypothetical protein